MKTNICLHRVFIVFSILILTACGGSGGSSSRPTAIASINFPPDGSLVDTQLLTVSGTAGGRDDVAAVRVNGVDATSSDSFSTWSVEIPLGRGSNTLTVELSDSDNNVHQNLDSVEVLNELFSVSMSTVAVDESNNRLLAIDSVRRAVVAIDLDSGEKEIFFAAVDSFQRPTAILIDDANNRALVLDPGLSSLYALDLTSAEQTIISGLSTLGTLPNISFTSATMAHDPINSRVLVVQNPPTFVDPALPQPTQSPHVLAIDLNTGEKTIFSGDNVPNADQALVAPSYIGFDPNQSRLLVLDKITTSLPQEVLLSLDLQDGRRSIFSGTGIPNSEFPIQFSSGFAIDAANNRALISQFDLSVLSVDLNSGVRSVLVDPRALGGSAVFGFGSVTQPNSFAVNAAGDTLYSVRLGGGLVEVIDLDAGSSSNFASLSHVPNSSNNLMAPTGVLVDNQGSLLVVDRGGNRVLNINPTTGVRASVYENMPQNSFITVGSSNVDIGQNTGHIYTIERETTNPPSAFFDFIFSLVAIDIDEGTRTVISSNDDGQAIDFEFPRQVLVDEESNTVYVADEHGLLSVDINTGERIVLVDEPVSSSPLIISNDQFTGIEHDRSNNRLLATNFTRDLIGINLDNLSQTVISQTIISQGQGFSARAIFSSNYPLLLDEERNRVLLANSQEIVAIDLTSGENTVLSGSNFDIAETPFFSIGDLVLSEDGTSLFVLDRVTAAIYQVDPVDGRAAIISR